MDTSTDQLNAPSCSSSSSSPPSSWDVFLSFYGRDTRASFVAHLYEALDQAGIQTFRDDPALEKGDQISPALFKAIRSSNKFVVVLSENYAYSPWCLDELVEILFCKKTKNQVVIPVFYYVNPTDVRYHKESFAKAIDFNYHKKLYSADMINKWRSALAKIAEISGHHLKKDANENESDTIQKIVENVARQASTKILQLEECLLGIDSAVEEIYRKLSMESNDVRAIGICGIGGIGKTTTAIAFFNKYSDKFDLSCFIENVRPNPQGGSPVLHLLEKLLIQLLRKKDYKVPDIESGKNKLEKILRFKKALVVLDDIDQSSQLELLVKLPNLFSPGTRIVITTKDTNLLNQLKVDMSEVDIYMVKKLGEIDSLELFSHHAFRRAVPPESFKELSNGFVSYAGGLPLALKVFGSSLRSRTEVSFWKAQLEIVRKFPEKEIQSKLQVGYDGLDNEAQKDIFLDIVFFFIGQDKDEAVHIFNSCGFYPGVGIPILVDRCLLTIDKDNKFQMHNLIQDTGREVIREESRQGKCRRVYLCPGNAWDVLQNPEGTSNIEVLILDLSIWTERDLSTKIFERMPNLRLLEIIGAHDINDVKGSFKNVFNKLRCIRWHSCPLTYLPSDFHPQQLVSLDMPYSKFETMWKNTLPLTSLKTINVSYSKNLKTTPDFKDFKLIEKLLFCGCENLLEVHPSVGQLTNLYHLDLSKCCNLKNLCQPFGQLTELGHLILSWCMDMKRLPNSIKQWTNMGSLNLGHCRSLKQLPEQLGDMKGLNMLDASYTAIEQLPDSIAHLKELVVLNLCRCGKLNKLPEQLGDMEGLKKLDVSGTPIEQLPDSIGRLINLVDLKLAWCGNLRSLPNIIWKLKLLNVLDLYHYSKLEQRLPDTINIKKLEKLDMRCNIRLWLPIILSFSSLKWLCLTDEGESFSSIKPFSLSTLSNLQVLKLHNCKSLGSSCPELPLNLEELRIHNYATLEQLPDLSSFKQLKFLHISNCISLQSLAALPPHLQYLSVKECTSLQHVPYLSTLKELRCLSFSGCSSNLKSDSLKQSFSQVQDILGPSFSAHLLNSWEFSRECTLTFEIPPILGDTLWGIALRLVYKFKIYSRYQYVPYFTAIIKNKTKDTTYEYKTHAHARNTGETVQSRLEYIRGDAISAKSGDIIEVSFETTLYSSPDDKAAGELEVEKCGAHVIQKTPSTPY